MKFFFLTVCTVFLLIAAFAQTSPLAGVGIEANYSRGQGIKHSAKMKSGFPYAINAFELNFVQQTNGKKDWQQRRKYPIVGFGAAYTDYDRNTVYGHAISIYPNIQIPLVRLKNIEWTFRAGFGLAYISKKYSVYPNWDTLNTAIGSSINNYSCFATDIRYRVNKHVDVQAGADFAHISNAAFRLPNLGINKFGAHIGIRYFPVTSEPQKIHSELIPLRKRILGQVRIGLAATEQSAPNGPMYPIYLATGYASMRYSSKNKVYAGLDYSYYKNVERFLAMNEIYPGDEKPHSWKSAVFIGNEFLIGRVGIIFQLGFYLKTNALSSNIIYEKLGGNLYLVQREKGIIKEFFPYIYLKTHGPEAELVESGFGFGF
jgi:hypothetical protein